MLCVCAQDRWTPLHVCAGSNYKECVKLLLEAGADKTRTNMVSFAAKASPCRVRSPSHGVRYGR